MEQDVIIKNIIDRIKEEWNKHKSNLEPEIKFEDFKRLCLYNLDVASKTPLDKYKIGDTNLMKQKTDNVRINELQEENKEIKSENRKLIDNNERLKNQLKIHERGIKGEW